MPGPPDPIPDRGRAEPNANAEARALRWLIDRIDGACLIETDAAGVFTHFGPGAEAMFGVPATQALGRLHYQDFHDPEEMRVCAADPEFKRLTAERGWTEDLWKIIPRVGPPFLARVTLLPRPARSPAAKPLDSGDPNPHNQKQGWIALYRRVA